MLDILPYYSMRDAGDSVRNLPEKLACPDDALTNCVMLNIEKLPKSCLFWKKKLLVLGHRTSWNFEHWLVMLSYLSKKSQGAFTWTYGRREACAATTCKPTKPGWCSGSHLTWSEENLDIIPRSRNHFHMKDVFPVRESNPGPSNVQLFSDIMRMRLATRRKTQVATE